MPPVSLARFARSAEFRASIKVSSLTCLLEADRPHPNRLISIFSSLISVTNFYRSNSFTRSGGSLNHETGRAHFFRKGCSRAVGKHNPRDIRKDPLPSVSVHLVPTAGAKNAQRRRNARSEQSGNARERAAFSLPRHSGLTSGKSMAVQNASLT